MENQPEVINTFANSEIAILRSGKAKKNDPPIPDDLAPISGNGKLATQPEPDPDPDDRPVFLDSIRFRYSTETIADETAPDEEPEEAIPEEPVEEVPEEHPRSSRRRKPRKPRQATPEKTEQPEKAVKLAQKKPAAPKAPAAKKEKGEQPEKPAAEGKKPHHRYHYRRRPGKLAGDKKPEA